MLLLVGVLNFLFGGQSLASLQSEDFLLKIDHKEAREGMNLHSCLVHRHNRNLLLLDLRMLVFHKVHICELSGLAFHFLGQGFEFFYEFRAALADFGVGNKQDNLVLLRLVVKEAVNGIAHKLSYVGVVLDHIVFGRYQRLQLTLLEIALELLEVLNSRLSSHYVFLPVIRVDYDEVG